MQEQDLGHGNRIIGFNSLEEILAYQEEAEAEANRQPLLPEQKAITWGSHVVRVVDGPLMIFGHIFTVDEFVVVEQNAGATSDELVYELNVLRDSYARNYRYGMYYSEACPQGEPGDAHLVTLWPITAEDFQAAREQDWKFSMSIARKMTNEVRISIANLGEEPETP